LEDGRGFRGRKKLLVAKVSSFPFNKKVQSSPA